MSNICTCGSTSCKSERSKAVYHVTGAATVANSGTAVAQSAIDPTNEGFKFGSLSVINDADQDIRVNYLTSEGVAGEFIVPESIKGFTKHLTGGKIFDLSSFRLYSMHASSAAAGNVTLNFGA